MDPISEFEFWRQNSNADIFKKENKTTTEKKKDVTFTLETLFPNMYLAPKRACLAARYVFSFRLCYLGKSDLI
jgi:hypothetical protein